MHPSPGSRHSFHILHTLSTNPRREGSKREAEPRKKGVRTFLPLLPAFSLLFFPRPRRPCQTQRVCMLTDPSVPHSRPLLLGVRTRCWNPCVGFYGGLCVLAFVAAELRTPSEAGTGGGGKGEGCLGPWRLWRVRVGVGKSGAGSGAREEAGKKVREGHREYGGLRDDGFERSEGFRSWEVKGVGTGA